MSYRTFKRMMGATSLERKCRFLFGGGLLILITLSFYLYGRLTSGVVEEQHRITGRMLVMPIVLKKHWEQSDQKNIEPDFVHVIEAMSKELHPVDVADYRWELFKATRDDPQTSPGDQANYDAMHELNQGREEWSRITVNSDNKREFQYYGAVRAKTSCLECHNDSLGESVAEGQLMGMAKVTFPLTATDKALAFNNAMLLTSAIVTAFLVMVFTFTVMRYVIFRSDGT